MFPTRSRSILATVAAGVVALATGFLPHRPASAQDAGVVAPTTPVVAHRTVKVDGLDLFYREAGREDAPRILLLHGFPTSSSMFRNLIPALADRYRLVAPDYPGFGNSSMPKVDEFEYKSTTWPT